MPKEVRRLIFSHAESTEALATYGRRFDMFFPQGRVILTTYAASAENEAPPHGRAPRPATHNVTGVRRMITVTYFDEVRFEHRHFNLTSDFIAEALIEYCIAARIMIPRHAEKELDVTEFNLCLDISFEKETTTGVAPLILDD